LANQKWILVGQMLKLVGKWPMPTVISGIANIDYTGTLHSLVCLLEFDGLKE